MCHICMDWESNQLSSQKAFRLIGDSLKIVESTKDRDHLMELCDKIVDSVENLETKD